MEEVFCGSIWCMINPLLTTDDVVMLRAVTSRWNEGSRCGALGCAFFTILKLDQHLELWNGTCGAGIMIQALTKTLGGAPIHKKLRPGAGSEFLGCRTGRLLYVDGTFVSVDRQKHA